MCLKAKVFSKFYKNKRKSDGYSSECKECTHELRKNHPSQQPGFRSEYTKKWRLMYGDKARKRAAVARRKVWEAAITAYGAKCACCGEDWIDFLTIDHINGGGRQHVLSLGGAQAFYRWLKEKNYPSGFQVLCYNCNRAKGRYPGAFCTNPTHAGHILGNINMANMAIPVSDETRLA